MRYRAALGAIVFLAAALRLVGLGWGLPRLEGERARGTSFRGSYHPDEDKILWQLERMSLRALELEPTDFRWGSLHTYLVGLALEAAERAGLLGESWKRGFVEGVEPTRARVFLVGRAVSAAFGVLTVLLVADLARRRAGDGAGLLAALLLAVSPLHVLHGHFLTADVALAFWILAALVLLDRDRPLPAGLAAGLALATKPSAAFVLPALALGATAAGARRRLAAGALAGFVCGQPYALLAAPRWLEAMRDLAEDNAVAGPLAAAGVLAAHGATLGIYGLGAPAALAAALGLRRLSAPVLLALATLFASLGLTRFAFGRYALVLVPLLAVAAGCALAARRRSVGAVWLAAALGWTLAVALGQIGILRDVHTAERAGRWIEANVAPGRVVARFWEEYPVLDERRYRLSLSPMDAAADVVVVDDLATRAYRDALGPLLERDYRKAARFRRPPRLVGVVLPEPWAPHDWRYTHPVLTIYLRSSEGEERPD